MRPPKPKPKPNTVSPAQEPRVQSKINSALSYGLITGKTYINKGAPLKPKKGAGSARGGYVSGPATLVKIQKIANAQSRPMTIRESALRNPTKRGR